MNIPTGYFACDHVFEVAQPVQTWGMDVLIANLPLRDKGSVYRVLASEDGTTVNMDGAFLATLDRGEFHETDPLSGNHRVEADKPVFVAQFMPGQGYEGNGTGDPAMGNMIPCEQFQRGYTFSTIGGGQFSRNYLTVLAHNLDLATIELDGSAIGAGAFTAIPGSDFSVAVLPLTDGTHTTGSTNPHGITVEGYNDFDSYLYPGGASFEIINPVGDANAPLCDVVIEGGSASGTARDDRPSEDVDGDGVLDPGEDLNGNGQIDTDSGVFFVVLDEAESENVSLTVAPFVPGASAVPFQVDLIDGRFPGTGVICISDGAGNLSKCSVDLGLGVNGPPAFDLPSPCGQTLMASVGVPISFTVAASDPDGDALTLTATGVPGGAGHMPALPVMGSSPVSSDFSWTPGSGDVGTHTIVYTVSDGLDSTTCTVLLTVAECHLVIGRGVGSESFTIGGYTFPTQLRGIFATHQVTLDDIPHFEVPRSKVRGKGGRRKPIDEWAVQVVMFNPQVFPTNPEQSTRGMRVRFWSDGSVTRERFGTRDGMGLWTQLVERGNRQFVRFPFTIDGL